MAPEPLSPMSTRSFIVTFRRMSCNTSSRVRVDPENYTREEETWEKSCRKLVRISSLLTICIYSL